MVSNNASPQRISIDAWGIVDALSVYGENLKIPANTSEVCYMKPWQIFHIRDLSEWVMDYTTVPVIINRVLPVRCLTRASFLKSISDRAFDG